MCECANVMHVVALAIEIASWGVPPVVRLRGQGGIFV